MTALSTPTTSVWRSFQDAMAEFAAEGRGGEQDESMIGSDLREQTKGWAASEGFARYVASLRADALEGTPRRSGFVPCSTWWWIDGETWLGRIALRHRLTSNLLEAGGHIGYDVRASARRQGHATAMLRAVLPHAYEMGIEEVFVTCDVDNVASRRVIETNGGRLEDQRVNKLRFWVPTAPSTRRGTS